MVNKTAASTASERRSMVQIPLGADANATFSRGRGKGFFSFTPFNALFGSHPEGRGRSGPCTTTSEPLANTLLPSRSQSFCGGDGPCVAVNFWSRDRLAFGGLNFPDPLQDRLP